MPKTYHCAYCGTELTMSRKALKNKGIILNLISPHECNESNAAILEDADKPTKNYVSFEGNQPASAQTGGHDSSFMKDQRSTMRTSTAPNSMIEQVRRETE